MEASREIDRLKKGTFPDLVTGEVVAGELQATKSTIWRVRGDSQIVLVVLF